MSFFSKIIHLILCLGLIGCDPPQGLPPTGYPVPSQTALSIPTAAATLAPTPAPIAPTAVPDTGWETLRSGLERRVLTLHDAVGQRVEQIYLLRLEPASFSFSVAYHSQPQTLEAWQAETGALVVVNGGYFRQDGDNFIPTGLTVVDGQASGSSYDSFAGMFTVTSAGPDLRWLEKQPYTPNEPLLSALQSFPLLVKPGGVLGFPEQYEDNQAARRTVIARDRSGRFLFLVARQGYFTLHGLSQYLIDSDLDLDIALNLDGGPSSGLLLAGPAEQVPSFTALPVVIAARLK
jgi:hypothetical protein